MQSSRCNEGLVCRMRPGLNSVSLYPLDFCLTLQSPVQNHSSPLTQKSEVTSARSRSGKAIVVFHLCRLLELFLLVLKMLLRFRLQSKNGKQQVPVSTATVSMVHSVPELMVSSEVSAYRLPLLSVSVRVEQQTGVTSFQIKS